MALSTDAWAAAMLAGEGGAEVVVVDPGAAPEPELETDPEPDVLPDFDPLPEPPDFDPPVLPDFDGVPPLGGFDPLPVPFPGGFGELTVADTNSAVVLGAVLVEVELPELELELAVSSELS
ncbi:MAG TPA: hypothetical protein VKT31_07200 [Solirubrobacteraceae bacterium]|nr:hypothetical protein [Solirubrobacteraceae bacterium]